MRKQLTKNDAEWQMFADYYKIYQDFYIPEETDEYWDNLMRACNDFYNNYTSKYAQDMIFAYLNSREALFNRLKNG